jgi:protein tyrosine/serine phosphatase
MSDPTADTSLTDPKARSRAMRELMWSDHGFLRVWFRNWHEVAPGMYRSNQPSPAQLERAATLGVRTVINLRGAIGTGMWRLEREACARLGLAMEDFTAKSRDTPSREFIHGINALFQRIAYPALMHCKSGADRAGIAATLFLILKEGRSVKEARQQLSLRYLHVKQGKTGMLDHFFASFLHWAQRHGKPDDAATFLAWVDNVYDPAAVKSSFMESWWGNMLTERILRRE